MEIIGKVVVYIIMACAVAGAVASIVKENSELGNEFVEGINSVGPIFLPVAGIMAAAPFITAFVSSVFGPLFQAVGADPAMAATTFIAVDMGGYQLAEALAHTKESWIMAMTTGYMAGATIVFSIPVGLKMIQKKDQKYLALGVMSGILTIPVGVLVSSVVMALTKPYIRDMISTDSAATYQLLMSYGDIFRNLIPLIIICIIIAVGLLFKPDAMIRGFIIFGRIMDSALKLVLVLLADQIDQVRALEVSGAIAMMLCGAFPMVYLIKKYLNKPLNAIGKKCGLSTDATTGILAGAANILALFAMIKDMKAEDKVKTIGFGVCGAFLIGDHLAFTANFQPNLILPILCGKLVAGICAVAIATKIAVPKAKKLEEADSLLA